jgi:membrane protein insertase Oxa1/YidC/SpoIIIJ
MFSPFILPLAAFALVVLIVAVVALVKVRDRKVEIHRNLYLAQMEHQRRMQELEAELQKLRQGA